MRVFTYTYNPNLQLTTPNSPILCYNIKLERKGHMSKQLDLLHGSIWDKALKFAIPLALTGMLQQVFSATDVAVVGRFAGPEAMAAVGSNAPLVSLLINSFVGIAIGANVIIANYIGRGDADKVSRATHTALTLALICGFIVAVAGLFIAKPAIKILGVPPEVAGYSALYLKIYFAGAPFILLYNFEAAIFRSIGKTQLPLLALSVGGTVNVLLNLFFVIKLGMSVDGVAIATVVANVISSAILYCFLCRETDLVKVDLRKLGIDRAIVTRILAVGVPSGLQSAVFSVSNLCVQSAVNSLGSDVMAASAAAFNIEIFAYFVINAFGQTCVTFVGQNYGAGNNKRVKESFKQITIVSEIVTVIMIIIMYFAMRPLLGLFSDDAAIIELGTIRVKCLIYGECINVLMENYSGILRGIGKSMQPAIITLIAVCGTRIAWVYTVFAAKPSLLMLCLVYPFSWVIAVILLIAVYQRMRRKYLC